MFVRLLLLSLVALLAGSCRKASSPMNTKAAVVSRADFAKEVRPVLSEYCFSCHNDQKHKGDVVLEKFADEPSVLADRATWEKVLKNLRNRQMPPEEKPQPGEDQRTLVANWIEAKLFAVDCNHPDPGRVTIRRLNRVEYNHTIRDLVGVDFHPADEFPADDVGYGFDNIGDVLSTPPVLLEKYLAAAERILDEAIVTPNRAPRVKHFAAVGMPGSAKGGAYTSDIRSLASKGDIYVDYPFNVAGEYTVRVRAFQQSAGGKDEVVKMALRLGGKEIKQFDVDAQEKNPKVFETTVKVEAGTRRLAITFVNPYSVTNFDQPPKDQPRAKPQAKIRTRRLLVEYLEVSEPKDAARTLPPSHQRLFVCQPNGSAEKESCAREIIGGFARRAFRRPVTAGELDRLISIFQLTQKQGEGFERGIQITLQAVLVSPHFLFRGEVTPEPNNPRSIHPVSDFALASRLSYFLWSSMPDDELSYLAARGEHRRPGVLDAQVQRMLREPKAKALVENFTGQWLQIRNLGKVTPDTNTFAGFTEELRADMETETELFFTAVMREDRSILDFIDGNYTFVNERLAAHYGIPGVRSNDFQKVLFKNKSRGGVLTHASILTITSNPTRTSPVKRGKWVLDNLLGTPPPPPPPDVPDLKDGKELTGTLRQKMEQHRANPNCASCHERMDPIGFGLENFNAIGEWRVKDGDFAIDTSGKLPNGMRFNGPSELRKILRAQKDLFAHCLTEKMLTYALGRGLEYYDRCAVDQITTALANRDYKFSVLISEIVKSAPFQMRRGDSESGALAATP